MTDAHRLCNTAPSGYVKVATIQGKDVFIYLDARDPEMARYEIALVTDTLKHAFHTAYGGEKTVEEKNPYWWTIDIGKMPMSVITHWLSHPEEMSLAERTALQNYLQRHPELIREEKKDE